MNPDEQSLYAEMRAAVRGDRERAERRAKNERPEPEPAPSPETPEPRRVAGLRRLFGRRKKG